MRNMLLLLLLVSAIAGCDIFAVRDSEPPTPAAPWHSYATDWELCLENLQWCYEDSRNAVKYAGLFTPEFAFHFAVQDAISETLSPSQEQDMLINLHSQSKSIDINLSTLPGQTDNVNPNEAIVSRRYTLVLTDLQNAPSTYSGNLELHFRKIGGYWLIHAWYDDHAYSDPSWGQLKYDHLP